MKDKGYFGIGCIGMKTSMNYGSLFRTAQVFNTDFIFLIASRFKMQSSDTMKSFRHMPLFQYDSFKDFNDHRPFGCKLIGIEMTENAIPIKDYNHPKQACYLLGSEDNGLTNEAINHCQDILILPGERSLNVAVAGSLVLFDRIQKI